MYTIKCDGLPVLDMKVEDYIVFDPIVNVGTNTVGECTFKIYSNHPHYYELHPLKSIFEVQDEKDGTVIFRGRMTNNTRDFYNGKAVDIEGAMAFFNDSMVAPFNFPEDFLEDDAYIAAVRSGNVVEFFLNWLIENHNSQVQDSQKFMLGTVTVADPNNYISRSSDNIASTWQILTEKLFDSSLGGYLCIRYERHGTFISYLADFEEVNTQEIRLGENLLDMKHEMDASTTYSAIIPIGADIEVESKGETTTKKLTLESIPDGKLNDADDTYKITLDNGLHAIYSKSAVENYGWICCSTTWDDVTDANNLKNKAREHLLGIAGFQSDSIEVTAADLHFTDEEISSFRMYKKVKVVSLPHNIEANYNLTKLSIDLVNPQNTKIVVGTTKNTLTDTISKGGSGSGGFGGGGGGGAIVNADSIISALGYTPANRDDIPTKVSELTNDKGYLAEETDPTVPAWAKAPTKPTYTADEVGADSSGTAETLVSGHNTNTEAHNDIRLLIEGLTTRLNTLADSDDTTLDQMSELVAYIKANRELIEGITTNKVNVSDIIDNLTTNVSNKPLSAAQGVALKSLIDALDEAKANKATTLAGYGITDGATKDELNGVQKNLDNHTSDKVSHITAAERTAWNAKADIEDIPTKYSDLEDDIGYVKQEDFDVHKHVWEDITNRPFSSTVVDVAIFENETFTNETVELKGVYYRHYFEEWLDVKFFDFIKYKLLVNGVEYTDYTVSDSSTIVFNDVAIGGQTTSLVVDGSEIRFIKRAYDNYELDVSLYANVHKIEKMHLPDDIGKVKTVNYIAPDENGNINIEGGSGSGKADSAFELIAGNTLTWNGDTEGRVVATNTIDPSFSYVRVSSVIPTLAELQKGGSWATTGDDGIEYEEPFTSEMIVDSDTIINCFDGYVLVAKEDNVQFVDEYTDCTLTKAGIYFIYFGDEGYTSKLTLTDYERFTKSILKMESMTPHGHDWYGKAIDKGNTVRSDDIIHGGFVKVSDAVPTLAEVQKGGTLRFYNVENGVITGDVIIANYLESPYGVHSANGEILIAVGGVPLVQIDSTGVYFRQDQYDCVHSLTINEYTDFSFNLEKVPAELLPVVATTTEAGLMSPEDKAKLDSLISSEGVGF